MKHKILLPLLLALLSAAPFVSAAPSRFNLEKVNTAIAERTTPELDTRSAADDSNCITWNDGRGDLKWYVFAPSTSQVHRHHQTN